jgi:hypothetical protein
VNVRVSAWQLACAIAATGCVKYEKFSFRDAGAEELGSGARAYKTGSHVTAEVPGLYKLEFGDAGYHFPDALAIGSTQVLSPTMPSCSLELGTGVSFYPAGMFTAVDQMELSQTKQGIAIDVPGPGVAKVALDWEAAFGKAGCTGSPSGRSTFTFFPDGRIQRMDVTALSNPVTTANCSCTSDSQWENATYYAFQEAMVSGLNGVVRPTGDGDSSFSTDTICFRNPTTESPYQIAIDYKVVRFKRMRKVGSNLAVIGDMIDQGLDPLDAAGDASTVMLIDSDSNCTELDARITPYKEDRRLQVDGTDEGIGMDGIYGGEHDGALGRRGVYIPGTSGTTVTLRRGNTGDVPAFAVRLDLVDFAGIASVSRDWASDVAEWYTKQEVLTPTGDPTGIWLLWFPEGLTGTRTITIEAMPK